MPRLRDLWQQARGAFAQERTWRRAQCLGLSALSCLGRRTISGMLCASGQQFQDWSSSYRLFEQERLDASALFAPVLGAVAQAQLPGQPLFAGMDDTLLRKRGRKVFGAGHWRDPQGPKFRTNLLWAQRFLQISLMLPEDTAEPIGPARGFPVQLKHAPVPKRPRANADPALHEQYQADKKASRISALGAEQIKALRQQMDHNPQAAQRPLVVSVDGGFTNRALWRNIPARTNLVGRIRKDAKLFAQPEPRLSGGGRPRFYGAPRPTPEQLRLDETVPWQTIELYAAGELHQARIKTLGPVRWQSAGARDLRLIVMQPLYYRRSKNAPLQHHQPLYLLCSDTEMDLQQIVQTYIWRWEIELNFRDEKTLLGLGQAQVRTEKAVSAVPQLLLASYSFLMLAARGLNQKQLPRPSPKWQKPNPRRPSAQQLLACLRAELWGQALGIDNLNHFAKTTADVQRHFYQTKPLASAVCYA